MLRHRRDVHRRAEQFAQFTRQCVGDRAVDDFVRIAIRTNDRGHFREFRHLPRALRGVRAIPAIADEIDDHERLSALRQLLQPHRQGMRLELRRNRDQHHVAAFDQPAGLRVQHLHESRAALLERPLRPKRWILEHRPRPQLPHDPPLRTAMHQHHQLAPATRKLERKPARLVEVMARIAGQTVVEKDDAAQKGTSILAARVPMARIAVRAAAQSRAGARITSSIHASLNCGSHGRPDAPQTRKSVPRGAGADARMAVETRLKRERASLAAQALMLEWRSRRGSSAKERPSRRRR